jgi:hypothetical protein
MCCIQYSKSASGHEAEWRWDSNGEGCIAFPTEWRDEPRHGAVRLGADKCKTFRSRTLMQTNLTEPYVTNPTYRNAILRNQN